MIDRIIHYIRARLPLPAIAYSPWFEQDMSHVCRSTSGFLHPLLVHSFSEKINERWAFEFIFCIKIIIGNARANPENTKEQVRRLRGPAWPQRLPLTLLSGLGRQTDKRWRFNQNVLALKQPFSFSNEDTSAPGVGPGCTGGSCSGAIAR